MRKQFQNLFSKGSYLLESTFDVVLSFKTMWIFYKGNLFSFNF